MKKIVSILLVAILAVTLCISMGVSAFAEGKVSVTVSVSPSSLTGAGKVSVKATVKNETSAEITGVSVVFPGGDEQTLGSIGAGDVATATNPTWNVPADMLDKELTFEVKFTDGNGNSQSFDSNPVTIKKKESVVKATANASVDMDVFKKGERPKFTFTLKNEGTVTLEKVSLKAPPLEDGNQIGSTFSLEPGETKKMTWQPNPGPSKSIEVKPVFSYTANGEKGTAKAGTVSVRLEGSAEPSASATPAADTLEVVATADNSKVKAGEKVTFTVTVRNQGEADLADLKVTDAEGNQVKFTGTSLNAGSAAKGTIEVTPEKTTSYVFTANAKDADGNSVKATSSPVEITVDTVDTATALTMAVQFIPTLSKPGPVDFTFKVKNSTGQEIKNIVISETTLGEIAKIDSMTEAEQDVTKPLQIDKTVSYSFKITGTLADGTQVESQTPAATVTLEQALGGMTPMLIILLVVVIAIAAVGIALGVYIHKNKKAGYTAFGKRRSASSAPRPAGNTRPQQQRYEERPPQTRQQQRQRPQMPREDIEPHARAQQQRTPQKPQQQRSQQKPPQQRGGKSDRNRF